MQSRFIGFHEVTLQNLLKMVYSAKYDLLKIYVKRIRDYKNEI